MCLSTYSVWHDQFKNQKHNHVSNSQVHAHDRELASSGAPELWAAHQSYIRTRDALKREDPPCRCPVSHTPLLKQHFDVCFKPLPKVKMTIFPLSRVLLLFVVRQEGRTESGGGHSVLEIKQVNFPSDRCSGGQGEEESTPQDTEMSSWQCARTHTHTENSRVTLHSSPKQYLDT